MANTISDELNRLIQAKAGIKSALEEKGLTIGDSSTLDEYPGLIQEMQTGGGSDTSTVIDFIERDLTSIVVPNGITNIGNSAFHDCSRLTSVNLPNSLISLGVSSFQGCTRLTNISIPNSVTTLQPYCFSDSGLNSIDLKNNTNITTIPPYCFFNNTQLVNVLLPNTITRIETQGFARCDALKTIIIPSGVSNIGNQGFFNLPGLDNIVFLSNTPPTVGRQSLPIYQKNLIYVKGNLVNTYKNADGQWKDVSTKIYPLADISYNASTYTVQALGRPNLELYIDASLCDSSVYTFTQGNADASHVIQVKSVDPSLGVLDTYTTEVLVEAAAPSYYAAPPTYTVGTPTYTYYQPSNCYKINLPVTFINAELQGYEGQYTTHRILGLANSDFSPVDDPDANPTKFYRYYQQNDTNTTLHLHNSVVVVYKDGNNNELYRTDSMNLDSSIVTDYWFKEQLSAPTIDIGQDRTEYFVEITSTDANADTIYYKINDGDWETVAGNTANIANGEISYGDIVYAYSADSNGNYLDSEIVSATPE